MEQVSTLLQLIKQNHYLQVLLAQWSRVLLKKYLLVGTAEPVGVLQNTLFSDLDEELVAAEGADVFVQMSGGNALLSVVLKRDGNTVQTTPWKICWWLVWPDWAIF